MMSFAATATFDDGRTLRRLAASIHRALRYDIFGIRGLTLQRFTWTALFVVGLASLSTMGSTIAAEGLHPSLATVAAYLGVFVLQYARWLVPAMIAITLADNLPLRGAWRVIALTIALLLAAVIDIPIALHVEQCAGSCADPQTPRYLAGKTFDLFMFTSAIAVACFARRHDQQVAAALHASEIARVDAERARLQSALQAMQARVEPAFLLDALHDVATLYESDRKSGARMLDLLIQYLRSALPQMRETDSTLEREVGLLRSYLGILALRSNGALTIACHFDEALADARMPPMILVPLVAAATPTHASSGAVNIDAIRLDGRVRITLAAHDAIARSIAHSTALSEVRARIKAIYGDRASFAVERNDDASRLILEIPYAREPSGARTVERSLRS